MDDLITSKTLTPHDEILPRVLFSILAPTPRHALLKCLVSPGKGMGEGPRHCRQSREERVDSPVKNGSVGFAGLTTFQRVRSQLLTAKLSVKSCLLTRMTLLAALTMSCVPHIKLYPFQAPDETCVNGAAFPMCLRPCLCRIVHKPS
jgi:hypothetical protein